MTRPSPIFWLAANWVLVAVVLILIGLFGALLHPYASGAEPNTLDVLADALDREGIYYLRSHEASPDPRIFDIARTLRIPLYVEWGDWNGDAILPFPGYQRPELKGLSGHPIIRAMHAEAIRRRGGRAIELDEELCQSAQRWANHMARTGSFRHGGGGYRGQIIAAGYGTVGRCFTGWMNSRGHRACILANYTKVGWGFQKSASGRCFWVGNFR